MSISISIIMPALNEAANIESAIRGVQESLAESNVQDAEILVMTCLDRNGRHDGTVDIVRRFAESDPRIRSVHVDTYQDLGEKFRSAVQYACKEHVIMVPGDNENDPSSFPKIFSQIGKADMVVSYTANPEVRTRYRRFLSNVYTVSLNTMFWYNMPYYNGINVYRTSDLRETLPDTGSFAYAAEILIRLLKKKRSYILIPIQIQTREGKSNALSWNSYKNVVSAIFRLRTKLLRRID